MPSNIEDVINDIQQVKRDLEEQIFAKLRPAMQKVLDTAIGHVDDDADWRGNLATSIRSHGVETELTNNYEIKFTIGTDSDIAPYAPFVEFGTGKRTEKAGPGSVRPQTPDRYPAGYPYSSPNVDPNKIVGEILEWVRTKPIVPEKEGEWDTAMAIAQSIVEFGTYAHPFMRPAWFKHKLRVRRAARNAVKEAFS